MGVQVKILFVLLVFCVIGANGQNTSFLTKTIIPLNSSIPVVYQKDVKGGFHQVTNLTARNGIGLNLKEIGMVVYQQDNHTSYQWDGSSWRQVLAVRKWETGAAYYTGDIFLYNNALFIALASGTIGASDNPASSSDWSSTSISALDNLANVNITSKVSMDVLQWDGTTSKWVNKTLAGAKITELDVHTTDYIPRFSGDKIQNSNITDNGTDVAVGTNLKIGTPSVDHITVNGGDLTVAGDAEIDGTLWAADVKTSSDERLKTNIATLTGVLKKINQLRGITYVFKDQKKYATGPQVGVIAQELQKVYPELVSKGADGYLGVNYSQLTAVLIQAIKEQQEQISVLSKKLETQQEQINNILKVLNGKK